MYEAGAAETKVGAAAAAAYEPLAQLLLSYTAEALPKVTALPEAKALPEAYTASLPLLNDPLAK